MPYKTGSWGEQAKLRSKKRLEYFGKYQIEKQGFVRKFTNEELKEYRKKIGKRLARGKKFGEVGKVVGYYTRFKKGCIGMVGEKHWNWQGGIGNEPYPFNFNNELKELIRKRDNYKCQLCGCPQVENIRKLCIHHIDYCKKNLNPNNLISLCHKCHIRVNYNREYWKNKLERRIKMPKKGKGNVMDKSPGDAKGDVKVPSWRGDKGESSAKGAEETDCVHYKR